MDLGPFSGSRSTGRGAAVRREPAPARAEVAGTHHSSEPSAQHAAPAHHVTVEKRQAKKKPVFKWLFIVLAVVVLLAAGWLVWQRNSIAAGDIDTTKYQAVLFTNGEVYFGKLTVMNDKYFKLTNVFYIQSQTGSTVTDKKEESADSEDKKQLIKMGSEVHGPEDAMMINRDQVVYYENLKPDGKVTQTISQYKK